jgi:biopolymer transport protein TolR
MIDVLLVLLIIFMVIVPVTPKGWMRWCPSRPRIRAEQQQNNRPHHRGSGSLSPRRRPRRTRSTRPMWTSATCSQADAIYANRAERVMFVRGDDDVNFAYIADVIDIGRAANVDHIGLMTPKIQAGQ